MADNKVNLIFELEDRASKEFKKFQKELKEIKKNAQGAGDGIGKFNNNTKKTNAGVSKLNKNTKALGGGMKKIAGALGLVAGAMGAVVAQTVALNKELQEQANFAGVSVEEMQKLGFAATQTGGTIQDMADALNEVTLKSAEAARLGAGAFIEVAKLAGISIQEFSQLAPEEQLLKFADATKNMDANLRNLLQDELGSDTFIRLNKLLLQGSDGFKKFGEEAERIGIVTEKESQQVAEIGFAFDSLQKTISTLSTKSVAGFSEEITFLIKKVQDLIIAFSEGNFARPISSSFSIIGEALGLVGKVIFGLLSSIGDLLGGAFDSIEKGARNLLLTIDKLGKNAGINILSKDQVEEQVFQVEILDGKINKHAKNIKENFEGTGKAAKDVVGEIEKFAKLSVPEQNALERGLAGLLKTQDEYNTALLAARKIYGENTEEVQTLLFNQAKLTKEVEKTKNEVKKLQSLSGTIQIDLEFQKAQVELLKFKGKLQEAFTLQATFDKKQLNTEVDLLISSLENNFAALGQEISFNPNIKLGDEGFDGFLTNIQDQFKGLDFGENTGILESSNAIIEKLKTINEYSQLIAGQVGIQVLAQQVEQLQLQLQLGEVSPEEVLAKMNEQLLLMQETMPATSTEILNLELQIKNMTEKMDVMGQITEKFAEDFADGMAKAFTDSLSGGEDFVTGMKNLLHELALSFIQAAIKALILTAIMRGINGGGDTSFGQDFNANFGSSLGVQTFHNGTGTGTAGDENGLRNRKKQVNMLNPSGSLNNDEIFAIVKKNEAVVQKSSLSSPTGVGSQNVNNEIKIDNQVTDDAVGSMMQTSKNRDLLVNIINEERDRIIL